MSAAIFFGGIALFAEASFKLIYIFYAVVGTAAPISIAVLVFGWNIRRGVNTDVDEKIKEVKKDVGKKLDTTVFEEHKEVHKKIDESIERIDTNTQDIKNHLMGEAK